MLDMIKERRWMVLTILLLVLLNFALITAMVMRDRKPWEHDRSRAGFETFLKDELALTPTQLDSFKTIRERHFKAGGLLMKALRDSMTTLVSEAFSPIPNPARVEALSNHLALIHGEMDRSFYNHFVELSSLCTPEQRERLKGVAKDLIRTMGRPSRKAHVKAEMAPPPEKP